MLIFLADTVHENLRLNPDTVPYNVARIAAYCRSLHPEHDYVLFKNPRQLIERLRRDRPDVLALSHYFWNTNLNHAIARFARDRHPETVIVTGGPNLDRRPAAYADYSSAHPYVDYVVTEEGETAFAAIVDAVGRTGREKGDATATPGSFAILGPGEIRAPAPLARKNSLDEFPSPYLNGMLDPFLAEGLRPIVETVRGCPYQCAFCEQGSSFFTKLAKLSVDRVKAEVDYIRLRTSASQLILADVNFGIVKQDLEVARFLKAMHLEQGWPRDLYVYNAKVPTQTTLDTMETLYPMAQLCMSFQSISKDVLENIHRSNIGYDKYAHITRWAKEKGLRVGTEVIYGLPGESRASFVEGCETLLGFHADYMSSYNLRLFPGVELNEPEVRRRYGFDTRFRLMDVNLGEYDLDGPARILETEEIVLGSSTATEADYFFTRRLAFLVEALWNTGYLRPALAFLQSRGFAVTAMLESVLDRAGESAAGARFFEGFDRASRDELAMRPDDFHARARDDVYWRSLLTGHGANVKVNLAFAGRLLYFADPELDDFLYGAVQRRYRSELSEDDRPMLDDVVRHCRLAKLDLDAPEAKVGTLRYDVPRWIDDDYPADFSAYRFDRPVRFAYAIEEQTKVLALDLYQRLRERGVGVNRLAERLYFEMPAAHRSLRQSVRLDTLDAPSTSDRARSSGERANLAARVSWTAD